MGGRLVDDNRDGRLVSDRKAHRIEEGAEAAGRMDDVLSTPNVR